MATSDYNTKPARGDLAIVLKLHGFTCNCMGSLEIARGQLLSDSLGLVKVSHDD